MRNVWTIKVAFEFWFWHQKCYFLWSENSHLRQKCPFLRPKNGKSKLWGQFYGSNIPQIWPVGLLFHEFLFLGPYFGQISILLIYGLIVTSAKNKVTFCQQKKCSNEKSEENKSGLEFNLPWKPKCASLCFEILALGPISTSPN